MCWKRIIGKLVNSGDFLAIKKNQKSNLEKNLEIFQH